MATEQGMFCFRLPREALDAMREMARARHMTTAAWLREQLRDGLYLGNPARVALGAEGLDAPPAPEWWPVLLCAECGDDVGAQWNEDDGALLWGERTVCSHCEEDAA